MKIILYLRRIVAVIAVLSLLGSAGAVQAETVSQSEAARIAATFFNAANGKVMAAPKMVFNGRKLTTGRLFSPYYIYNHPTGGFVIVSAENKAFPILAYSRTDSFNPSGIDSSLEALLSLYARHIEYIRYDSSVPEEAVAAWTDINNFIAGLLFAPAEVTDALISTAEASEMLARTASAPDNSTSLSAFYSPGQWSDIVDATLRKDGNAVVGVISPREVYPLIVQGRKGAMYRISFPSLQSGYYRLLPTEILSAGEVVPESEILPVVEKEEEDTAFRFYDDFIASVMKESGRETAMIEEILSPQKPVVVPSGSGYFTVKLPGAPRMARIYNVAGSLVGVRQYKGAGGEAHIDIVKETPGFYFAVIFLEDGRSFGVKLYR